MIKETEEQRNLIGTREILVGGQPDKWLSYVAYSRSGFLEEGQR